MQGTEMTRDEEIRQVAYRLWQEAGRPDGYDVQHWLEAEIIWLEEHRPQSGPKQSKPKSAPKEPKPKKRKGQTQSAEREL
jgi:hypothetical protein